MNYFGSNYWAANYWASNYFAGAAVIAPAAPVLLGGGAIPLVEAIPRRQWPITGAGDWWARGKWRGRGTVAMGGRGHWSALAEWKGTGTVSETVAFREFEYLKAELKSLTAPIAVALGPLR